MDYNGFVIKYLHLCSILWFHNILFILAKGHNTTHLYWNHVSWCKWENEKSPFSSGIDFCHEYFSLMRKTNLVLLKTSTTRCNKGFLQIMYTIFTFTCFYLIWHRVSWVWLGQRWWRRAPLSSSALWCTCCLPLPQRCVPVPARTTGCLGDHILWHTPMELCLHSSDPANSCNSNCISLTHKLNASQISLVICSWKRR